MASAGGESGESLSLNLTPMLDIFSILVTFLLMSYSTDPTNHDVDANLELPDSVTLVSMDEIPAITITKSELRVNDRKLFDLENGAVPAAELAQGAIPSLHKALKEIQEVNRAAARELHSGGSEEKKAKPGEITVEMDKKHVYKLLNRVMLTGQQAEFITFKLLVAKPSVD